MIELWNAWLMANGWAFWCVLAMIAQRPKEWLFISIFGIYLIIAAYFRRSLW